MRTSLRAFTLIEVMIGIAILAIVMAVPRAARDSVQGLAKESDYRFALRNARFQQEWLRAAEFDRLPPEVVKVRPDGSVPLSQPDVVPGSLKVRTLGGAEARPGDTAVADYRFYLPDRSEAHTVPSSPPYRVELVNTPVVRLVAAYLAEGETLRPLPATLSPDRTALVAPASAAGRVVLVDYLGQRIRNEVSGRFLTADLRATDRPSGFKLLRLQESYAEHGVSLTSLKVKP